MQNVRKHCKNNSDCQKHSNPRLDVSDRIALGVGLDIGIPSVLIALIVTCGQ
jgi:hypothetical protein